MFDLYHLIRQLDSQESDFTITVSAATQSDINPLARFPASFEV